MTPWWVAGVKARPRRGWIGYAKSFGNSWRYCGHTHRRRVLAVVCSRRLTRRLNDRRANWTF